MSIPLADTPTVGLGRFIKESRFEVPTHQRDFSWTDVYVTAFLRDVEDALRKRSDIYFCGLMVHPHKHAAHAGAGRATATCHHVDGF